MGKASRKTWFARWDRFMKSVDPELIERYKQLFGWTKGG